MNQTSVIFAALVIGFIVYITTRGRLPLYIATIWQKGNSGTKTTTQTPAGTPSLSNPFGDTGDGSDVVAPMSG